MAQQRALFISENFIKSNTEIDSNVDVRKLLPTVWWCQKGYIEPVLGSPLFESISSKIVAGELNQPANSEYLTLVDAYIADALVNWFMIEVQIALLYNYRNKSTGKNDAQWSDFIDSTEVRFLRDQYRPRADYFIDRLETYLCANTKKFPEYNGPFTSDDLTPTDQPPQIPVFLGLPVKNPNKKYLNTNTDD